MSHRPSRRRFLQATAALAAGPFIIKPHIVGAGDMPAPSNRITLGLIGPGKQGSSHLAALVRRSDVQILAICDVQEEKRQAAKKAIETIVGVASKDPKERPTTADPDSSTTMSPWTAAQLSAGANKGPATKPNDVKYYGDFRDVLARPDIDAVLIATPDHWHAAMIMHAAAAGKDIYCEKPLTLTIREAQRVVEQVHRYGRVFQTGSQQRSSREFRFACEMVRSGRIGELKQVIVATGLTSKERDLPAEPVRKGVDWNMWLGPAPEQTFNKILCPPIEDQNWAMWRLYRDFSGGAMTDFGAHHFDIAQWAVGADHSGPVEILPMIPESAPGKKDGRWLTMKYANGVELQHANTFEIFGGGGLKFIGTEGQIDVDRGTLKTYPKSIGKLTTLPNEVHLYKSPGHHEDFLRAVRTRSQTICPVEVGARSVSVCHLGNICYWLNRPLKYNPQTWSFEGDEEANRWLDRAKRAPWYV